MFIQIGDKIEVICRDHHSYKGELLNCFFGMDKGNPTEMSIVVKEQGEISDMVFDKVHIFYSDIQNIKLLDLIQPK